MSQHYSDPNRKNDPHALPNIEVWFHNGVDRGLTKFARFASQDHFQREDGEVMDAGWYWWACFPGCLPDGDPMGPFDTEAEALADAQEVCAPQEWKSCYSTYPDHIYDRHGNKRT